MQKPVSHACFVYVARLRVAYFEVLVAAVAISASREIGMKRENIGHQGTLEFLHIPLLSFTAHKLLPRREQIFERNDIVV